MDKKSFGTLLSALRKANGMTQKDLAARLNVSDKAISRWERDENYPDLPLLPVIAEIFNVTTDELLRGERNNPETGEPSTAAAPERSVKQVRRLTESVTSRFLVGCIIAFGALLVGVILRTCAHSAYTPVYSYDSYNNIWEVNPRSITGAQILFALAQGFAWVIWVAGITFVILTFFKYGDKLSDTDFAEHETSLAEGRLKLKRIFRWTISLLVAGFGLLITDLDVANKPADVISVGFLLFLIILVAFHLLWWLLPKIFTAIPAVAASMRSKPFFGIWRKKCVIVASIIALFWLLQLFAGIRTDGLIYAPGRVFFSFKSFQEYMGHPESSTHQSEYDYYSYHITMARSLRSVAAYKYDSWTQRTIDSTQGAFYCDFVSYAPRIMLSNECYDSVEESYLEWPEADPERSFYWNNFNVGAILLGDFNNFLPIRVCTKSAAELGFWIFVVLSVAIPVVIVPLVAWLLWRKYRKQYERWNDEATEAAAGDTAVNAEDDVSDVATEPETDAVTDTATETSPETAADVIDAAAESMTETAAENAAETFNKDLGK
ncbi:MAG: helix-turn-helix domain-containing protein [Lachnospiraceae bacterium]|nr:helix-turn-helix domain-containing protein [Lachnospiraceae bacterium]